MKVPNKIINYKESTISKFPIILKALEEGDKSPIGLYKSTKRSFNNDITEFVDSLDCLFALGKIELNKEFGVLHYVKKDIL